MIRGHHARHAEIDVVLGHEHRARASVGIRVIGFHPLQLEARPRRRRRIGGCGEIRVGRMRLPECRHLRQGPFVIPQRRGVAGELPGRVDQHGAVHLAAGANGFDSVGCVRNGGQHLTDHRRRAAPPVFRSLLGPTVVRDDLLMLLPDELENRRNDQPALPARCRFQHRSQEIVIGHSLDIPRRYPVS